MTQIFLVEFTALVDAAGTAQTFRVSSASQFMTRPTEDPPNAAYPAYVESPGQYERHCWSKGATRGASTRGFGVISLVNSDGAFDACLTYGLDGQPVRVLCGPETGSYPADFIVLFTGTARRGQYPSRNEFDLVLVDRQGDAADFTFQPSKFAGTNVDGTGLEGLPTDIQGKPKPDLIGTAGNVPAICVNTLSRIYQIDSGSALAPMTLRAVYDKRTVIPLGTAYTPGNLAAFLAGPPASDTYNSYYGPEGWYFMLGSAPIGLVTCDVSEGALNDRTPAQCAQRVAASRGKLPIADMDGIDAMDALKPYECGIWIGEETTVGQVIDALLDSGDAFMTDSRVGRIRFGCLQDPALMTAVTTIYDWMIKEEANGYVVTGTNDQGTGLRLSSNWDGTAQRYAANQDATLGLPCWRVLCLYNKNFQVMSSTDLAGAALADIAYARLEYRTVPPAEGVSQDSTVLAQHRKAPEFTVTTLIVNLSDATTEAKAQLALRKVPRYVFAIPLDPGQTDQNGAPVTAAIDLGTCFTLVSSRYGCAAGKNLFCIGIAEDFGNPNTAALSTIYAWG